MGQTAITPQFSFRQEFVDLYYKFINDPKLAELLKLEGIHLDNLDYAMNSKKYFTKSVPDATIDSNANGNEDMSHNNYTAEVSKPYGKLEGYYLLWRQLEKAHGVSRANELLESIWMGNQYFHDPTAIQIPYCWAFSTTHIMTTGRPYGQLQSVAPKRGDSFIAEVIETTMDLSQEFAGAIAPSDMLFNYSWFAKREINQILAPLASILGEVVTVDDILSFENGPFSKEKPVTKYTMDACFYAIAPACNVFNVTAEEFKRKYGFSENSYIQIGMMIRKVIEKRIENDLQKVVHVFNNKFRASGQSPFTNITLFDRPTLKKLFEHAVFPDGSGPDYEFVMLVQKVFGAWFSEGDPVTGLPYRFPVVSVNIYTDPETNEVVDDDFLWFVAETNYKKGCYNIYGNDGTKIASCCRLSNDFERMKFKSDSFGGGGLNIGAHRVVTINLPRIAMLAAGNQDKFFKLLDESLYDAADMLVAHRALLTDRIESGFLKFFKPLQWFNLNQLFSVFGTIGQHEMCYYMGLDILTPEGEEFALKVATFIEDKAEHYSNVTGKSFSVEEIPGESTAVLLPNKDKIVCGVLADEDIDLYSNQYVPLIVDAPRSERIRLTGKFMKLISGGSIFHDNHSSQIESAEQMYLIIKHMLANGIQHFATNYGYGICKSGHVNIVGNDTICPTCGEPIDDYLTRIIGYFTKVSSWNPTRRNKDFPHRMFN